MKRGRRGSALIEAGLTIPVVILLFVGVADVGRSFRYYNQAVSAARDAAQLVVNRYSSYIGGGNDSAITSAVSSESGALAGKVTRFYTCPNASGDDGGTRYSTPQGCSNQRVYVRVTASAPFTAVMTQSSQVSSAAVIRVQ
jgi:Flp pilus assembly protein TadG